MIYNYFCKCDIEMTVEENGQKMAVGCEKCGLSVKTDKGERRLRERWYEKGGRSERREKYVQRVRESFSEFVFRVETETRIRLANEHADKLQNVSLISDEKLDKWSKSEIETLDNGTRVVRIGPKKTLQVTEDGRILSKSGKEQYGTLDTIEEWDWSGFWPVPKDEIWKNRNAPVNQTPAMRGKRKIFK